MEENRKGGGDATLHLESFESIALQMFTSAFPSANAAARPFYNWHDDNDWTIREVHMIATILAAAVRCSNVVAL